MYYHHAEKLNFYVGGGPYVGFALTGKANNYGKRGTDWQPIFVFANETDEWYNENSGLAQYWPQESTSPSDLTGN